MNTIRSIQLCVVGVSGFALWLSIFSLDMGVGGRPVILSFFVLLPHALMLFLARRFPVQSWWLALLQMLNATGVTLFFTWAFYDTLSGLGAMDAQAMAMAVATNLPVGYGASALLSVVCIHLNRKIEKGAG